ncbi:MAG: hypothetical protein HC792_06065 [Acaryochloridaceae cyanobacterium CSU_5_19]|nr:hypothetical protein [Acaryochloridaceae cyanobacterium CSU_5_19]
MLTRNYDTINPKTGKTYLGADALVNNGDEETAAIDEWASASSTSTCSLSNTATAPNMTYTGMIGPNGKYTLRAYRYNSVQQTGTFLVEGQQGSNPSYVMMTIAIDAEPTNFPGILTQKQVSLRNGRPILGSNGNVYYNPDVSPNPTLKGSAAPGDANRPAYLSAIEAASTDNISGTIFACALTPTFSMTAPTGATSLGNVTSNLNISGTGGGIKAYQASQISLTNNTMTVDTTNGPVYLYVDQAVQLWGTAQIQNIRTDGVPPRVGDLRILPIGFESMAQPDIQTAFLFADPPYGLHLDSTADGCSSPGNTNVDGVVWGTHVLGYSGGSSGIGVPDDVSSLSDILTTINLPIRYKFGQVKHWQQVRL